MPAFTTLFHATPTTLPYLLVHSTPLPVSVPLCCTPRGMTHRSVLGFSYQSTLRPTTTPRPLSAHIASEQARVGAPMDASAPTAASINADRAGTENVFIRVLRW